MIPETDFPDIRNKCAIHSSNGSSMIIPREDDKVRLYLQLADKDVLTNGRVDRSKTGPEKLLEVHVELFSYAMVGKLTPITAPIIFSVT